MCRQFMQEHRTLRERIDGKLRRSDVQRFQQVSGQINKASDQMMGTLLRTIGKAN